MATRRGRPPKGAAHAARVAGSEHARTRLDAVLRTLSGEVSVTDASETLGISDAHFHRLRDQALQGAAEALEPRAPGRPAAEPDVDEDKEQLRRQVQELKLELEAARIREEMALVMPKVMTEPKPAAEKKTDAKRRAARKRQRRARQKQR